MRLVSIKPAKAERAKRDFKFLLLEVPGPSLESISLSSRQPLEGSAGSLSDSPEERWNRNFHDPEKGGGRILQGYN